MAVGKFSQNDEEIYILDYFRDKTNGKFIDIGAFHATHFSNTRALYERGWGGVLVEPAPSNYAAIAEAYKDEPRIQLLNVAIGEPAGMIDFYESNGDAVGTTDEGHMTKWGNAGVKYTKIQVPQMGVVDFFNQYGKDTDFLSIDTEATNMVVFRHIPDWVFEQISYIVVEHDWGGQQIEKRLKPFGFSTYHQNAENILLGK